MAASGLGRWWTRPTAHRRRTCSTDQVDPLSTARWALVISWGLLSRVRIRSPTMRCCCWSWLLSRSTAATTNTSWQHVLAVGRLVEDAVWFTGGAEHCGVGVPGEEALDVAAARGASLAVTVVRPDAGPPPDVPEGGRGRQSAAARPSSGWGRGRGWRAPLGRGRDGASGVCGEFACDAPDRWDCGVSAVGESAAVVGGAGSGGGWVSCNDVLLTPAVHVDVVGLRPVLWAVGAALVPGCRFAGADQRPVVEVEDHRSAIGEDTVRASSISVGSWPGFGRRVSLAAGGERTRNSAGHIRIRPLPGVDILGLENPKRGGEKRGPDRKGWKTRTGLYRLGSAGRWGRGVGLVVLSETQLDRPLGDFDPFGHSVHGKTLQRGQRRARR